jgi:O-antigen/teichoic acid export membrane protein
MANTLVSSALGFIFWIVAARFYNPTDVGLAAAVISAASLLAVFSNLGFNFGVVRFLPNAQNPVKLVNTCLNSVAGASLVLSILFLLLVPVLSPALLFVQDRALFALSFIVIVLVWAIFPLIDHVFVAKRTSNLVLVKSTIFNSLKIPLAIFAAYLGAFGIFASWGIAMAIASGVALLFFMPKILPDFVPSLTIDRAVINDILHFSLGNYVAHFLYLSPGLVLPLMVLNLLGAQMNAYYYVTFMIAEILFVIPTAISQSLFAEGSTKKEGIEEYIRSSLKMIYLLMIPAIVIVFLLAGPLLLLFGSEYSGHGSGLLRVFALSGVFLGVNLTYITLLRLEKKVGEIIGISGFLALGILGLSYSLLLSTRSIVAVGYSWMAIQGIISIYAGWAIQSRV